MISPSPGRRSPRFRVSIDTLVLGALLLVFAGLSYVIAAQDEPSSGSPGTPHRSSYSTAPGGWRAFFRLLETRGNRVKRVQQRPREWPPSAGVVITGPYSVGGAMGQWSHSEAADALSWVTKGGVLIAFTDASDELTSALGLRTSEKTPLKLSGPKVAAQSGKEAKAEIVLLKPRTFAPRPKGTSLTIRHPVLFLENVSKLKAPGEKRYTAGPANSIVLAADIQPLVLAVAHGRGMIFVVADAGIPDNTHLAKADNARFVTQLAEAYTSKKRPSILFDEYHQGYRETNTFWTAIGRPGQLAFWQMAALFVLMAYSASRRFGLPRPLPAPSRVSSEYVASLADLYRRARATDAALEAVLKIFWRNLCRAAGMTLDAPLSEVAQRVAAEPPGLDDTKRADLAARIRAAVQECRAKLEVPEPPADTRLDKKKFRKTKPKPVFTEAELLRLVTTLESLRKELDLGGRSHV